MKGKIFLSFTIIYDVPVISKQGVRRNKVKLMHLGDLHLGRSLGDFDLTKDQEYILNQLLEMADKEAVDAVLIAGDVYDKAVPSESATALLDYFLSGLAKRGIRTFMISGNHDSDERLKFGSRLFETNNIFIATKYDGSLCRHTLKTENGEADIYMLPFVKASRVRHYLPEAEIGTYDDAVRAILDNAGIDNSRLNILVAHQFVVGRGGDPTPGGSEGIGTLSVGLVEKIGYDCFDSFDYVALGHIHSPQQVGRETIRYSGSPLKYSLSEANNEKSVPIVTLNGKGDVKIELLPVKPMRDMRHIKGEFRALLDRENAGSPEDFIYATLTDEEIINDAMGIFQQVYPNTIKIDYDNSHTREIEKIDISRIADNRPFEDLIGDFYRQMYGCEISGEEMEIMRTVAREAGVFHEAD